MRGGGSAPSSLKKTICLCSVIGSHREEQDAIIESPKGRNSAGLESSTACWSLPTCAALSLALATGGTEKSWYRCIFPFGIVSVVIGVAATCITFTINGPQMDIAKVVSVATLIFGVGLLVAAYVCWRAKRERQQRRQRQEPGSVEQGAQ
uniref:Transmembrane protein 100 n=1 Tax=Phasianus colchicus TaxID=9054 RepID=A0A669PJD2_PHACC